MAMLSRADLGSVWPFQHDSVWVEEYLDSPGSIYSDLHVGMFMWQRGDGPRGEAVFPEKTSQKARAIAWDLGLTKALPGWQALTDASASVYTYYAPYLGANLSKAGVLPTYYEKAYELYGNEVYAITAELAVALQILHEWVEAVPPQDRIEQGIYADVLTRFESATSMDQILEADLTYLADILRGELSLWRGGGLNTFGIREIPTPLRIARVAAAFATSQGGFRACKADGSHDPQYAGAIPEQTQTPICPTDATDRAVYRWYRALREKQLHRPASEIDDMARAARLVDAFADIKPAWAGAFSGKALDWSNHAEIIEAQVAVAGDPARDTELDFYRLVERANLIICRSSTR
ncbi:MAG: hypothetical protein GAK28_01167 [Luteibacter sp.]|uniref:hypothetical protein n=1 Tax=Luteibacter sp. TaxID=1886636 RepID=UPI00137C4ED7|nr:hypothetical protein [Luteibacter sp.]KAF1008188.1 MAG: hypothetical protein GAK28_01167 [Luteibacter sp.]